MYPIRQSGLSRRAFLRGLSALGVGAALAACAPSAAPESGTTAGGSGEAPSKEGVTIQYWVFWSQLGALKEAFEQTEEWQEAMGDNTWEFRSGIEQEARLTAVAAGTPPDIGALGNYLDFMIRGVVIPLDDYVEASDIIDPEQFIASNWDVCQHEGKTYGIPANECFVRRGLNYNVRLVEEAGLDPDNPPVTWDELFAWHEKLTKFDSAGNIVQIGIDPYDAEGGTGPGNDGWFLQESWGFNYYNEETREFNLDHDKMAAAFEVMGEFIKLIGPDNLVGLRSVEGQGTWGAAYTAQVQAMIIEGYWHPGETYNENPEVAQYNRATWVPVPEDRRGTKIQFGGGHMVQIFRDGRYKDEAWPIAEWLQSKSCNDLIYDNIGWLPAYKPYFDQADQNKYPGLKFYFDSVAEANYWGPFIRCPIQAFVQQKYQELREAVYRGQMTGAQAAARLQEEAEKELAASGF
ncbi:MAG: ABC transporter substrate-binding protein [Litorilinea sp.]|nr:MAG: ABC transporter substrate-binding protein [Litorilinea sp.]